MAGDVHEISDDNFEQEVLQSGTPVLVDFWAEWCGPCKALAPTVAALAGNFSGKVKFCKVNVDESPHTAAKFGIRSIPTLLLFQQGKTVGQLVGNVPRPSIEQLLSKAG